VKPQFLFNFSLCRDLATFEKSTLSFFLIDFNFVNFWAKYNMNFAFSPNLEDDDSRKRRRKKERSSLFFRKKKDKTAKQSSASFFDGAHHHNQQTLGSNVSGNPLE